MVDSIAFRGLTYKKAPRRVRRPPDPGDTRDVAYVFIITGQSLSAGNAAGDPVQTPVTLGPIAGHYQFDNLWNDAHTAIRTPSSDWTRVAVKNPMRQEGANDNFYPFNTYYETPHAAMAERFGQLGLAPTNWTHVGRNALPYAAIKKGGYQPSYAGSITELQEWVVRNDALDLRTVVAGIVLIHGESDLGNANYGPVYLPEMQADYNADCKAVTGQTEDVPLYFNQPSAAWPTGLGTYNDISEQMLTAHNGTTLVCVGPKYAVQYNAGDIHLVPSGTRQMGILMAEAIYSHRYYGTYDPLEPSTVVQTGNHTVECTLVGTDSSSIEFDSTWWDNNHSTQLTEWADGYGFELSDNSGRLTITDVQFDGNVGVITTSATIGASPVLSYAHLVDGDNKPRRGQVRTTTNFWLSHFTRPIEPLIGGFDITSLAWEIYLLGDNLNADYQIDAVAVGNSAGRHFRATSDDSLLAGGTFGLHDSVDLQSKEMWSLPVGWFLSDVVNTTSWSFVCIADLQSFSAIGTQYYDVPTLIGTGGGSVYWGIGISNIAGTNYVVAGAYDVGFYSFAVPASTGKQVIQWRCVAGVQQMRINKDPWTTGPTITDITLVTGRLDTDMGAGKANADVALYGISKTAFDDATFDDICDLAADEYGVTL